MAQRARKRRSQCSSNRCARRAHFEYRNERPTQTFAFCLIDSNELKKNHYYFEMIAFDRKKKTKQKNEKNKKKVRKVKVKNKEVNNLKQ